MTFRNLQQQEDIPGICENENCENFKAFELYDVTEIKKKQELVDMFSAVDVNRKYMSTTKKR